MKLNSTTPPRSSDRQQDQTPCVPIPARESATLIAINAAQLAVEKCGREPGFEQGHYQSVADQAALSMSRLATSLPDNRCLDIRGKMVSGADLLRAAKLLSPRTSFNSAEESQIANGSPKSI